MKPFDDHFFVMTKYRGIFRYGDFDFLEKTESELQINAYPNPCHEQIFIEPKLRQGFSTVKIGVFNAQGQLVYEKNESPQFRYTIPTNRLPSGLYFLKIHSGEAEGESCFVKR